MSFFERFKQSSLVQLLYKFPLLFSIYHFTWAFVSAIKTRFPSRNIFVIGVTGTKGKTTTLELINAILEAHNEKTALMSSVRIKIGSNSEKNTSDNSMPGRGFIQKFLRRAVADKCTYALVEVTSEGVKLFRHRFVKWRIGVLTNLTPEHIEAHGSFENYRGAKLEFLRSVGKRTGMLFINGQDQNADFFLEGTKGFHVVSYNTKMVSEIVEKVIEGRSDATVLFWEFNSQNVAAAVAVARHLNINDEVIIRGLRSFSGVAGRLEFVQKEPFSVVVDYAHTPDSLEKLYSTIREHLSQNKKLICVFGSCGGGRDRWKRPVMGEIAAHACDSIFLTNEDPFNEDPNHIIQDIQGGVSKYTGEASFKKISCSVVLDRRVAIERAIAEAQEGDAVVITGKGSESWIREAGGRKIPWNERNVIEEILVKRAGGRDTSLNPRMF